MKQRTKNKMSLKAVLIVVMLIVAFILPSMANIPTVNADTVYLVVFELNGGYRVGGGELAQYVVSGSYAEEPLVEKVGCHWAGWDYGKGGGYGAVRITSDLIVYALWVETTVFNVIFDYNGGYRVGGGAYTQQLNWGENAVPPIVERNGYTFTGWLGDYTNINCSRIIYAQWVENENNPIYTVTFNPKGGTLVRGGELVQYIKIGCDAILPVLEREGYAFLGWYEGWQNITSDRTIESHWVNYKAEFVVNFDLNGGKRISGGYETQSLALGESAYPPIVVRDGYTFAGWIGNYTNVTSSCTVFAQWEGEYTVVFNAGDGYAQWLGGGWLTQSVASGGSAIAPIFVREKYIFTGWDKSLDNITSNCTITAQWELDTANFFAVTFDLAGGTQVGEGELFQLVYRGESANLPIVEREGYIFTGWLGDYTNVTSSRTITAQWEKVYTVIFNPNGGTYLGGGELVQYIRTGSNAIEPTVSREGFAFTGWSDSYIKITSDRILTAQWKQDNTTYNITFDLNGGTWQEGGGALVQSVITGGSAIEPTVTREGYILYGWYGIFNNVTSDKTIIAQWKEAYTVTFNLNGGTWKKGGGELVQTVITGGSAVAPMAARDGYVFIGWSSTFTNINSNQIITAQWREIPQEPPEEDDFTKTLTATITPANADNKLVDWTVSWANDATRKDEDVSQYIIITPSSSDGLTVVVTCLKAFAGDTIIITVTTRDGNYSAQCTVTYSST